tara:strand:- start:376 stop:1167 length:792 start_codon:yes stop_codon:yes gene_type:complete
MHGKYFQAIVKPTITAANQHTAFTNRDVLFDWTPIEIPKGTAKLISVVAFVRPKGDAGVSANLANINLWFANDDRTSFGTVNAAQDDRPHDHDLIGCMELTGESVIVMGANSSVTTMVSGPAFDPDHGQWDSLVFSPKLDHGDTSALGTLADTTPGFGRIYVAGISGGHDFTTLNRVNEADADAGVQSVITMDGSGMDCRAHFTRGDILHGHDGSGTDDVVLGEVLSAGNTAITLTAGTTDALREDDFVYNIHPIKFVFNFEY